MKLVVKINYLRKEKCVFLADKCDKIPIKSFKYVFFVTTIFPYKKAFTDVHCECFLLYT